MCLLNRQDWSRFGNEMWSFVYVKMCCWGGEVVVYILCMSVVVIIIKNPRNIIKKNTVCSDSHCLFSLCSHTGVAGRMGLFRWIVVASFFCPFYPESIASGCLPGACFVFVCVIRYRDWDDWWEVLVERFHLLQSRIVIVFTQDSIITTKAAELIQRFFLWNMVEGLNGIAYGSAIVPFHQSCCFV